ncbi:MAG: Tim44/TimA family putative adaptor protein [Alphaproteobacteria bacterium]|nr:Tim44/TimA family putative adaptor protein [Alphaproteobacteria bacterium]
MEQLPYADILILALIAGFILLRLRSVLGQKSEGDNPQFFKRDPVEKDPVNESVVQIIGKPAKAKPVDETDIYLGTLDNQAVAGVIADIKKIDASFNATSFMQGAKMAYEMVFDAFAKGDKKTLEMLLDKPLYDTFSQEIDLREKAVNKTETTLVSVRAKDIVQATLSGTKARLAVSFDSEQVSLVKDAEGRIIEGDASQAHPMDDEWLFERDISSRNPNWKILET